MQVHGALCLAFSSHAGQLRKSGEPYITHPVEVTRLLAELRSDHESLIAGLLHDTVEDTTVRLHSAFGNIHHAVADEIRTLWITRDTAIGHAGPAHLYAV